MADIFTIYARVETSDIPVYRNATLEQGAQACYSISTSVSPVSIGDFITGTNFPNGGRLLSIAFRIFVFQDAGSSSQLGSYSANIFKRATDGTETLLSSGSIPSTLVPIGTCATAPSGVANILFTASGINADLVVTDRLVLKLLHTRTQGAAYNLAIFVGNKTFFDVSMLEKERYTFVL